MIKKTVVILWIQCFATLMGFAQLQEGDIVSNFTLPKHGGGTISLHDYAGQVIVIDFFAYWCGPCQTSSPELDSDVAEHYQAQGGTPNGLPVTVLAISIDNSNASAVNSFVQNSGLDLVALDSGAAWSQFGQGYVPHFAVVNGVAGANYQQWEVIHTGYGYRGANFYKNQAESVALALVDPPVAPSGLIVSED